MDRWAEGLVDLHCHWSLGSFEEHPTAALTDSGSGGGGGVARPHCLGHHCKCPALPAGRQSWAVSGPLCFCKQSGRPDSAVGFVRQP